MHSESMKTCWEGKDPLQHERFLQGRRKEAVLRRNSGKGNASVTLQLLKPEAINSSMLMFCLVLMVGVLFYLLHFLSLFCRGMSDIFQVSCLFIWEVSMRKKHWVGQKVFEVFVPSYGKPWMNFMANQGILPIVNMTLRQAPVYNNMNFVQVTTSGCSVAGGSTKDTGLETKGQARLQGRHAPCQATSHRRWGSGKLTRAKPWGPYQSAEKVRLWHRGRWNPRWARPEIQSETSIQDVNLLQAVAQTGGWNRHLASRTGLGILPKNTSGVGVRSYSFTRVLEIEWQRFSSGPKSPGTWVFPTP